MKLYIHVVMFNGLFFVSVDKGKWIYTQDIMKAQTYINLAVAHERCILLNKSVPGHEAIKLTVGKEV